jgi:Mrp family chromosome partitioning ATPase
VPAGSESGNAAEHFNSIRFQQFIDAASSRYENRYVILDTPPILESADTSILVGLSDAVILVVPYGKITSRQMQDALDIIGKDRIMGVVINNEPDLKSYFGN